MNEIQRWDLPCIINLNARSLNTEKIDELQVIASNFNVSIICVTETWLKDYIDDVNVSINPLERSQMIINMPESSAV